VTAQRAFRFERASRLRPADRAAAYARAFPQYPASHFVVTASGFCQAHWVLGNSYGNSSGYYGSFPGGLLRRIWALYPDVDDPVLHVCSGSLRPTERGVRLDVRPAIPTKAGTVRPSVVGDARALPFVDGAFELAIADVPYSAAHAAHYGTSMPSRRHVLAAARRALKADGQLAWLDTKLPMYRKDEWTNWGHVCVVVSTNHDVRLLSLFARRADGDGGRSV